MTGFQRICQTSFIFICASALCGGCGGSHNTSSQKGFFTSGNREADQRADQRMAQAQQLHQGASANPLAPDTHKSLYDRLGGADGVKNIVDDFTTRILADPRVNFSRKGVERGGISLHRGDSMEWNDSPYNVDQLKKHIEQFIALSTGGPSSYDGKDIKGAHADMHITNAEFDATAGDLKATLDKLKVPDPEQKELLAVVETTRQQIVEER
jgi:hemoglobin